MHGILALFFFLYTASAIDDCAANWVTNCAYAPKSACSDYFQFYFSYTTSVVNPYPSDCYYDSVNDVCAPVSTAIQCVPPCYHKIGTTSLCSDITTQGDCDDHYSISGSNNWWCTWRATVWGSACTGDYGMNCNPIS